MSNCVKFLAINLKNFLDRSGLTQAEFARKLDVSPTYLNQLLKRVNGSPSLEKLEKIASVLGTTVPALISDPDVPAEIHPDVALRTTVEHLKILARKHGYSWPPSIDFFFLLFQKDQ